MVGVKLPALEVEKFTLKDGGRGLYAPNDGVSFSSQTWTGKWMASGGGFNSSQALPAASATAWFKFTIGGTAYYVPGFNTYW
jgi:hypothetical protein